MSEPKRSGPPSGPNASSAAKPAAPASASPSSRAAPAAARASPGQPTGNPTGQVIHDARGNAVWDWLKETSRIAIESTTRLLRKLESPELNMEDTQDKELRLTPDQGRSAGGGYDPYNQPTKPGSRKPRGK